jgi:hypothetical protein
MTIDVFGLTATDTTDMGIGQQWEKFVTRQTSCCPWSTRRISRPGRTSSGTRMPRRSRRSIMRWPTPSVGAPGSRMPRRLVPWYQDFTLGPPRLRRGARAGTDACRLQARGEELDAVESREPLHGRCARPGIVPRIRCHQATVAVLRAVERLPLLAA